MVLVGRHQGRRDAGAVLVTVVVDVVAEVVAGVAILVNVLEQKGYNPAPCTFPVVRGQPAS
jgi:hypothetical protein